MLTFAITTTTKIASISLYDDRKMLGEIRIEVTRTHSTSIMDQIDKLLEWTNKKIENIENVVVSIGPGSFTGIRIAISIVKGFFYGKDVNVYEVNEIEALANQVYYLYEQKKENITIYSMIDSGKEKIYYGTYKMIFSENQENRLEKVSEYKVSKLDEIIEQIKKENIKNSEENIYLVGDAAFNYYEKIKKSIEKEEDIQKKLRFMDIRNIKIDSSVFIQMLMDKKLRKTTIYDIRPDYLEKSQAERDKK